MKSVQLFVTFSIITLAAACASNSGAEKAAEEAATMVPDSVTASPDMYKTVFENDSIRIVHMAMAQGAEDVKHTHPQEAVYLVKGGTVAITEHDGQVKEMPIPDGAAFITPGPNPGHTVKNVGDTDVEAVIFEIKEGAKAEAAPEGSKPDAITASPEVYTEVISNERGTVIHMKLPKGAKDNWHSHHAEAVYILKGGKVRITVEGEDKPVEMDAPDGAAFSNSAIGSHQVENIGDTDIEAVIFELRG